MREIETRFLEVCSGSERHRHLPMSSQPGGKRPGARPWWPSFPVLPIPCVSEGLALEGLEWQVSTTSTPLKNFK